MEKRDLNQGWFCRCLTREEAAYPVTLPHDAMIREPRTEQSEGEGNIGWFLGGDYEYTKKFVLPAEDWGKKILLEFESVYHNAEVYLNGKQAAYRPYGYTNFYVEAEEYVRPGEENEIRVIARNSDQPNSRWYPGTGIYRPVWLYVGEEKHIPVNGVKIRTISYAPAVIEVEVRTSTAGEVQVEILDEEKTVCSSRTEAAERKACFRLEIPDAKLWSCETPKLYVCRATFGEDVVEETFGIRLLEWNPEVGMAINGKHVILRGACIHHDNGLLGACAYPEAEERKVRILKENGYNALRSAHYPCSKAILEACDRLGMLMMDEYVDVWYIHKTEYDYARYMETWWKEDLRQMVEKDFNHPSVILYSTGNEVSETAQGRGISLTGKMTEYLHRLDAGRPVTCGINIFFNFLSSIGFGVYSDEKAKKEAEKAKKRSDTKETAPKKPDTGETGKKKKKTVGSEFYNTMAGLLGDTTMKVGATLHGCDVKTRDAFARMDIAGYNYGIFRYKHDLKKYPDRLILGSETFCKDAYRFWETAKANPRIVGDFVWAGMDYMGEAAIGSWEYEDYAPAKPGEFGWLTAGSGRVDILGKPNAEAAYTKIAFEQMEGPVIAVKPVYQTGKHSPSAWKMTNAMESWSWRGCEGQKAEVEVYVRAAEVELFVNGESVGRKKLKNTCYATFRTVYQNGTIEAAAYDADGTELRRTSLQTAGEESVLRLRPEEEHATAGGLVFIPMQYTDAKGIWKPMEKHTLKAVVENGTLAGFGNACPFNLEGYGKNTVKTYYGEAMAVIRADRNGPVILTVTDEAGQKVSCQIPV